MRSALSALVIAAGLVGFGAGAQASPLTGTMPLAVSADRPIVDVQMDRMERRMMRRNMERRMMRRKMERRMMRRNMRRDMMRRM